MKTEKERMYNLLPSFYREEDAQNDEHLRKFLKIFEVEIQRIEDRLKGLKHILDIFDEDCVFWVNDGEDKAKDLEKKKSILKLREKLLRNWFSWDIQSLDDSSQTDDSFQTYDFAKIISLYRQKGTLTGLRNLMNLALPFLRDEDILIEENRDFFHLDKSETFSFDNELKQSSKKEKLKKLFGVPKTYSFEENRYVTIHLFSKPENEEKIDEKSLDILKRICEIFLPAHCKTFINLHSSYERNYFLLPSPSKDKEKNDRFFYSHKNKISWLDPDYSENSTAKLNFFKLDEDKCYNGEEKPYRTIVPYFYRQPNSKSYFHEVSWFDIKFSENSTAKLDFFKLNENTCYNGEENPSRTIVPYFYKSPKKKENDD